jgi:hypothetical protein
VVEECASAYSEYLSPDHRLREEGPDIVCSLAMAEMTALVGAVYRRYETSIAPGFENKSPAITSRFETFYDVTVPEIAVSLGICCF